MNPIDEYIRSLIRGVVREVMAENTNASRVPDHFALAKVRDHYPDAPLRTLMDAARSGDLVTSKVGKAVFVRREEIERYFAAREQKRPARITAVANPSEPTDAEVDALIDQSLARRRPRQRKAQ